MGFTREQYLQSAQKALMFFAINVALITYHKLNKSAPDGDAAAFEAAEPKSLGEQVGSFFAAVKAFLAGSPEIGGFLAGIVVLVLYKTLLLEKPAPAAADGPARKSSRIKSKASDGIAADLLRTLRRDDGPPAPRRAQLTLANRPSAPQDCNDLFP